MFRHQKNCVINYILVTCFVFTVSSRSLAQTQYTIVDLTDAAEEIGVDQSQAESINEAGQIVGWESVSLGFERGIFWDSNFSAQFVEQLPGDNSTIAAAIADDGTIYGLSEFVEIVQKGQLILIFEDQKATIWNEGGPVDLSTLVTGGDMSFELNFIQDFNNAGSLIGFGSEPDGPPFTFRGFLFNDGFITNLGALNRPIAINNNNQIVGYASSAGGMAYIWDNGKLTNLHDHPAIMGGSSRAFDINDEGSVVGTVQFNFAWPDEPAVWINGEPIQLIPDVTRSQGDATAINNDGKIVGYYNDLDDLGSQFIAFIWEDGKRTELLDLLVENNGWTMLFPFDINEAGQIVGGGWHNGVTGHAFVMTPILECPWDLDNSGFVGTADLLALFSVWGTDPAGPPDFDEDGTVNTADLLILFANWGPCP